MFSDYFELILERANWGVTSSIFIPVDLFYFKVGECCYIFMVLQLDYGTSQIGLLIKPTPTQLHNFPLIITITESPSNSFTSSLNLPIGSLLK